MCSFVGIIGHEASDESLAVSSEPLGDGAVTPIGDDPNFCKA